MQNERNFLKALAPVTLEKVGIKDERMKKQQHETVSRKDKRSEDKPQRRSTARREPPAGSGEKKTAAESRRERGTGRANYAPQGQTARSGSKVPARKCSPGRNREIKFKRQRRERPRG